MDAETARRRDLDRELGKAIEALGFAEDAIRNANNGASALEHLLILPLIQRAADLFKDVEAFRHANWQ